MFVSDEVTPMGMIAVDTKLRATYVVLVATLAVSWLLLGTLLAQTGVDATMGDPTTQTIMLGLLLAVGGTVAAVYTRRSLRVVWSFTGGARHHTDITYAEPPQWLVASIRMISALLAILGMGLVVLTLVDGSF